MISKLIVTVLLLSMASLQAGADAPTCYDGSKIWKWVEGREGVIVASAKCNFTSFASRIPSNLLNLNSQKPAPQRLQGIPEVSVETLSSKNLYIDQTTSAENSFETERLLKQECAKKMIPVLQAKYPGEMQSRTNLEIQSRLELSPGDLPEKNEQRGFSFKTVLLSDAQKKSLSKKMNSLNSCSSFETTDEKGIGHISNCKETGIGQVKQLRDDKKLALAMVSGVLANLIRGGQIGSKQLGGNGGQRLVASAILAGIPAMVRGDKLAMENILPILGQVARGFIAMSLYQTRGFVNGGQSGRGIGSQNQGDAFANGVVQNAILFAGVCGLNCAKTSPLASASYVGFGQASNNNYQIGGIDANVYSEAMTGALLGYSFAISEMKKQGKQVMSAMDEEKLEQLRLNASNLCVKIEDIVSPQTEIKPVAAPAAAATSVVQ